MDSHLKRPNDNSVSKELSQRRHHRLYQLGRDSIDRKTLMVFDGGRVEALAKI
jgi:hypothetical protein